MTQVPFLTISYILTPSLSERVSPHQDRFIQFDRIMHHLLFFLWVGAMGVGALTFLSGNEPHPANAVHPSPLADGKSKFLGNVYSSRQEPDFAEYWNQVTPENAGKWGSAEPSRDQMNWEPLDAAYRLAKENSFPFKLHALIWGNQQPAWMEDLPTQEQREEIEEWFAALAERYPEVDQIDVVNEPLNDPPDRPGQGGGNYIQALGGKGASGWDWVLNAFSLAREHFPDAELLINEYNIVNKPEDAQRYLDLVNLLQTRDLIDGIGVQAHAFSTRAGMDTVQANLDLLASANLPVYVTELDIDGPSDAEQLTDYQRIFPVFWEHPSVAGITCWGWRPGMWRTREKAFLVNADGTERPALSWLREYIKAH